MKLYIWEGRGISSGYHDDGTLVVLAETIEQARELAIKSSKSQSKFRTDVWRDGKDKYVRTAIQRKPQRVVELDEPRVVVFNGGGYD